MSLQIPAYCPSCGAVFASRLISISGNVSNLRLSGNKESCPFCGEMADTAEGVFDIAGDFISIISAPHITKQMISELGATVTKAYKEKITQEKLAEEIGKIHPSFGDFISKVSKKLFKLALLIIIGIIGSSPVNVNLSIDVNRLIDQLTGKSPTEIISGQKNIDQLTGISPTDIVSGQKNEELSEIPQDLIKENIKEWASSNPLVKRAYLYGSRAKGDHKEDSDIDIAIEIDTEKGDSNTLATWTCNAEKWRQELQPLLKYKLHLEWEALQETPKIKNGLDESSILLYERKKPLT